MEHVSSVPPTGKFPEKVENLKRWFRFPGWNFRTESRVPFTFLVVCTSSRSTVGHRHVPGFTTKWNNFLPIGNSTFATTEISEFFPKWKAPYIFHSASDVLFYYVNTSRGKEFERIEWLVEPVLPQLEGKFRENYNW